MFFFKVYDHKQKYSHIFQLLSWGIPALQTVVGLATGQVEGDNVSGMCQIGPTSPKALNNVFTLNFFEF